MSARRQRAVRGWGAAALWLLTAGLVGVPACRPGDGDETQAAPRVEQVAKGPIRVTLTADPAQVRLDRDLLLTIGVTAPHEFDVSLPDLSDRLTGFVLNGVFDDEPSADAGTATFRRHARLTPILSTEYRIAPMAVVYTSGDGLQAEADWIATPPVVFDLIPPVQGPAADDICAEVKPVWVRPPFRVAALYAAVGFLLLGLVFMGWKLARRIRRRIEERRLSPRERALKELAQLLARDLVGHRKIKEFYLELTMIVRRYIERAHRIRAPEQTTEEFLAAASRDRRFAPAVLGRLKSFLEAADLVKFAAHRPPDDVVRRASDTARDYIETDDDATQPQKGG